MTRLYAEHPELLDAWANTAPDAHAQLELDVAHQAADEVVADLTEAVNRALAECTERQRWIWRCHTGVGPDGTVRDPLSIDQLAEMLQQARASVRSAYNQAHVRVLTSVLTTTNGQRELAEAMALFGDTSASPMPTKGRLDSVAAANRVIQPTASRPDGAHGVRLAADERLPKKGPGEHWTRYHQFHLDRMEGTE